MFISQVLRYVNVCIDYDNFVGHSKTLIAKLRNQFYSGDTLKTFRKFGRIY